MEEKKKIILKKIGRIAITATVSAGILVGAGFAGAGIKGCNTRKNDRNIDNAEYIYQDILTDLNNSNLTNNKIISIDDVQVDISSTDEGIVKIYTNGINAKGKEYDCSFSFKGDKAQAEQIDNLAEALSLRNEELSKSAEELKRTEVMGQLIDYLAKVDDFVKSNKKTATYQTEVIASETLKYTNDKQEEVDYTSSGVIERIYEYLAKGGLKNKEEADKFYNEVKNTFKNKEFKYNTTYSIDVISKQITIVSTLPSLQGFDNRFSIVLNVPEDKMTATDKAEKKAQMIAYALEFLQADTDKAHDMLSSIVDYSIEDACSAYVWNFVNKNVEFNTTLTNEA